MLHLSKRRRTWSLHGQYLPLVARHQPTYKSTSSPYLSLVHVLIPRVNASTKSLSKLAPLDANATRVRHVSQSSAMTPSGARMMPVAMPATACSVLGRRPESVNKSVAPHVPQNERSAPAEDEYDLAVPMVRLVSMSGSHKESGTEAQPMA
ncbi:hypothetical protein G6O67_008491 [Ophiocordyceps sinensis]|uniref:Uncharacterized protein n=1 Tax=Ophiocordyceps sinensis TaxID=72228 RepID=A0A8H4LS38_9HYPO|nr:hypothetical protein G6O67_008491 [Ophiocordyceps sinensis]